MKKLRCKKQYGSWKYQIIYPNEYNDLEWKIYELFADKPNEVEYKEYFDGIAFGCYDDMKYFVETGVVLA